MRYARARARVCVCVCVCVRMCVCVLVWVTVGGDELLDDRLDLRRKQRQQIARVPAARREIVIIDRQSSVMKTSSRKTCHYLPYFPRTKLNARNWHHCL